MEKLNNLEYSTKFTFSQRADDGCAIGACYLANFRNNKKKFFSKSNYNSYLGSRYSDDEIEIELKNLKLDYLKV